MCLGLLHQIRIMIVWLDALLQIFSTSLIVSLAYELKQALRELDIWYPVATFSLSPTIKCFVIRLYTKNNSLV